MPPEIRPHQRWDAATSRMATARRPSSSGRYRARNPGSGSGGRGAGTATPPKAGAIAGADVMCSWSALGHRRAASVSARPGAPGGSPIGTEIQAEEDQPPRGVARPGPRAAPAARSRANDRGRSPRAVDGWCRAASTGSPRRAPARSARSPAPVPRRGRAPRCSRTCASSRRSRHRCGGTRRSRSPPSPSQASSSSPPGGAYSPGRSRSSRSKASSK